MWNPREIGRNVRNVMISVKNVKRLFVMDAPKDELSTNILSWTIMESLFQLRISGQSMTIRGKWDVEPSYAPLE
jgi:hypothetical protein